MILAAFTVGRVTGALPAHNTAARARCHNLSISPAHRRGRLHDALRTG